MIDGEPEPFNPTESEQEMPYKTYGSVLIRPLFMRDFVISTDIKNADPLRFGIDLDDR
jgi:hypothetical protein